MILKNTLDAGALNVVAKVYHETMWAEYIVRLYVNGTHLTDADYFAETLDDAMETQQVMFNRAVTQQISDRETEFMNQIDGSAPYKL